MIDVKRYFFLARYYTVNLLQSKIGGHFAKKTVNYQADQWNALRASYSGHKNWLIVGNGPSLTVEDLEALNHIPAVASNKITLIYNRTNWRPALYTIGDPLLLFKLDRSHYDNVPLALMPHYSYHMARTKHKLAWRSIPFESADNWIKRTGGLPDPIKNGFIEALTVTTANIQLAMWCGAKTIFLIGCDHNYREERHDRVVKLYHGETKNHFDPEYRKPGEIVNNAPIAKMNHGFRLLRRIADYHGIRIINITRKTALQTFEQWTVEQAIAEIRSCSYL